MRYSSGGSDVLYDSKGQMSNILNQMLTLTFAGFTTIEEFRQGNNKTTTTIAANSRKIEYTIGVGSFVGFEYPE